MCVVCVCFWVWGVGGSNIFSSQSTKHISTAPIHVWLQTILVVTMEATTGDDVT